jgi:2-methylcitrate dehydratase PrpD
MRKKVKVITDDNTYNTAQALVAVEFDDSSTLEKHIEHVIGSLKNPLTEADLKKQFMYQVTKQLGEVRAQKAYAAFMNMGNMTDTGNAACST